MCVCVKRYRQRASGLTLEWLISCLCALGYFFSGSPCSPLRCTFLFVRLLLGTDRNRTRNAFWRFSPQWRGHGEGSRVSVRLACLTFNFDVRQIDSSCCPSRLGLRVSQILPQLQVVDQILALHTHTLTHVSVRYMPCYTCCSVPSLM